MIQTDRDGNESYLIESSDSPSEKTNGYADKPYVGKPDVGKPKVDKFQPGEGDQLSTFCPLVLWQCRDALQRATGKAGDKRAILAGSIRVRPASGADPAPAGPKLGVKPYDLVSDPDAFAADRYHSPLTFDYRIPVYYRGPRK